MQRDIIEPVSRFILLASSSPSSTTSSTPEISSTPENSSSTPEIRLYSRTVRRRAAAKQLRRRNRRAAIRDGLIPHVASIQEWLRLPFLMLPAVNVRQLVLQDTPVFAADNLITQLGFQDLSSSTFTSDEEYVLGLGLGFVPTATPRPDILEMELLEDTRRFTRRVLLADYFAESPDKPIQAPAKFKISNKLWLPPPLWNPSPGVHEFITKLHESVA